MTVQSTACGARRPAGRPLEGWLRPVARMLSTGRAAWRSAREQARTRRALEALNDAALGDIGLARAEIGSAAAELHGRAERTRVLAQRCTVSTG